MKSVALRFLAFVLCAVLAACAASGPDRPFDLRIVHVNDTHARLVGTRTALSLNGTAYYVDLGGFPRLDSKLKAERAADPSLLFLHAGDVFQGTLYFSRFHGQADLIQLNLMRPAAMCLGNHEFDAGPPLLADFVRSAGFPVLAANVDVSASPDLRGLIQPFVILDVRGQKVGVIGLLTAQTATISSPGPTVRFLDLTASARDTVAELERRGVNKIIVLSHEGYAEDKELAGQVDGIDVIVGGHSHTLLGDFQALGLEAQGPYPTVVTGPAGHKVCVVQSWEFAKAVGRLDVHFDAKGEVLSCAGAARLLAKPDVLTSAPGGGYVHLPRVEAQAVEARLAATGEIEFYPDDPEAAKALAPYTAQLAKELNATVAEIAEDLPHIRVPGRNVNGVDLPHGSLLAPLVAQGDFQALDAQGLKPDLAMSNAGGVRLSLPRGRLSFGMVTELLPFRNTLVLLEVDGATLRAAIAHGLTRALDHGQQGSFPYFYNLRYAYSSGAGGVRLLSVEVRGSGGLWRPLDDGRTYRAVFNSYVAGGGDGYDMLKRAPGERVDSRILDSDAFADFARRQGTLHRPDWTGVEVRP